MVFKSKIDTGTTQVATTVTITDDTTTNATVYPVWVGTASGNQAEKVSSTKLTFNPSTGNLGSTLFTGAVTATTLAASGQPNFSGPTLIQKYVSANTTAAYAMDAVNGAYFDLTLNANSTITVTESIAANQTQIFGGRITQDGTGGWTLAWSGMTWNTGVTPVMPTAIGATLYFSAIAINGSVIGFSALTAADSITLASIALTSGIVGRASGVAYSAGYIGEVISSTIAIGSAISLSTGTAKTITSIALTAGVWNISGNIGFIAASGTLPTILEGSISTTADTQATSPNSGAYFRGQNAYTVTSTQIIPTGNITVNISTPTTYYLVGAATFTVSTLTAYGSISGRRIA